MNPHDEVEFARLGEHTLEIDATLPGNMPMGEQLFALKHRFGFVQELSSAVDYGFTVMDVTPTRLFELLGL